MTQTDWKVRKREIRWQQGNEARCVFVCLESKYTEGGFHLHTIQEACNLVLVII